MYAWMYFAGGDIEIPVDIPKDASVDKFTGKKESG